MLVFAKWGGGMFFEKKIAPSENRRTDAFVELCIKVASSLYLRLSAFTLGDVVIISKVLISKSFSELIFWAILMKLLSGECHRTLIKSTLAWLAVDVEQMPPWWRHEMEPFPRHWPFVRGIHRAPVNSPHKGQWREALIFSLICAWMLMIWDAIVLITALGLYKYIFPRMTLRHFQTDITMMSHDCHDVDMINRTTRKTSKLNIIDRFVMGIHRWPEHGFPSKWVQSKSDRTDNYPKKRQ